VSTQGTIVASIPFDPSRDGFSFENYGFAAGPQLTPHVMREMFGDVVCADTPSDSCTLTPAAQGWAQAEEDSYIAGHCQGFSVTALRFFTHNLTPSQFGGAVTFALPFSPALESEIEYGAVTQDLDSVKRATLTGSPSEIVSILEKALRTPNRELYVLGIHRPPPDPGGHAIIPIGVERLGGGQDRILVYDNNFPGVTRAVSVDTNANTWVYDTATNPDKAISTWSGQGQANPIELQPLSAALGVQPCPFCAGPSGSARSSRMVQISLGGNPVAHGHLLITTADGRRVGYVHGRFVDEIRGARVRTPLLNEIWNARPEPIYEIPASGAIRVTLDGRGSTGRDPATVHVVGAGFGATVSNLLPSSSTSDRLVIGAGGRHLSLGAVGSAPSQAPTLELAIDRGKGGQELSVTPSKLSSGNQLTVAVSPSTNRLSVAGSGATPVALTLTQVGHAGSHTAHKGNIALTPNRPATFSLGLFRVG
jgi:hypothetical protein